MTITREAKLVRADAQLWAKVKERAEAEGMSAEAVVRIAVRRFLDPERVRSPEADT